MTLTILDTVVLRRLTTRDLAKALAKRLGHNCTHTERR